jgi:hypothetical protein
MERSLSHEFASVSSGSESAANLDLWLLRYPLTFSPASNSALIEATLLSSPKSLHAV